MVRNPSPSARSKAKASKLELPGQQNVLTGGEITTKLAVKLHTQLKDTAADCHVAPDKLGRIRV